jgi:hypothetical protein
MKELGWFFTFLGSGGFIGTMVAKDSQKYKLDNLAGYFGKNTDNPSPSASNNHSDFSRKINSNDFPNPSGKTINDLYKKG